MTVVMEQLAFDFDVAPDWEPIPLPELAPGSTWKAHLKLWRCRDCGSPSKLNQGGGKSLVCDDCAVIDGCGWRAGRYPDECEPGRHISKWGDPHTVAQHADGVDARLRRRAAYLRAVGR